MSYEDTKGGEEEEDKGKNLDNATTTDPGRSRQHATGSLLLYEPSSLSLIFFALRPLLRVTI